MKLLIDTHLLLWAAGQRSRLPRLPGYYSTILGMKLLFSAASLWESAIKRGLGA